MHTSSETRSFRRSRASLLAAAGRVRRATLAGPVKSSNFRCTLWKYASMTFGRSRCVLSSRHWQMDVQPRPGYSREARLPAEARRQCEERDLHRPHHHQVPTVRRRGVDEASGRSSLGSRQGGSQGNGRGGHEMSSRDRSQIGAESAATLTTDRLTCEDGWLRRTFRPVSGRGGVDRIWIESPTWTPPSRSSPRVPTNCARGVVGTRTHFARRRRSRTAGGSLAGVLRTGRVRPTR